MCSAKMLPVLYLRITENSAFPEFPRALVLLFEFWTPKKGNITRFLLSVKGKTNIYLQLSGGS